MNLTQFFNQLALRILDFLPLILAFCNYFAILKTPEQRASKLGIAFFLISLGYFFLSFYFLLKNWNVNKRL